VINLKAAKALGLVNAYADMPMIEVHENYVRVFGPRQVATLLAVLSRENLEIAEQLKPRLEWPVWASFLRRRTTSQQSASGSM
jgi:hypothetical protein